MDLNIAHYMRQRHNLLIGDRMAEEVKIAIGSAFPMEPEQTVMVRGRDLISGLPRSSEISSLEVRDAIAFMRRMVHPKTRELEWKLSGLSVTAPHKSLIIQELDWIDPVAREIGAVPGILAAPLTAA